jgi:hypothetical protein
MRLVSPGGVGEQVQSVVVVFNRGSGRARASVKDSEAALARSLSPSEVDLGLLKRHARSFELSHYAIKVFSHTYVAEEESETVMVRTAQYHCNESSECATHIEMTAAGSSRLCLYEL